MTRQELLHSREYWITKIQLDLYAQVEEYMKHHQLTRTQLADQLNVTKGYVSQLLNGDFDHKISKLVDMALAVGKVPKIEYYDLSEIIIQDANAHSSNPYVFKAVVRGDLIQNLTYIYGEDSDNQISETLTA